MRHLLLKHFLIHHLLASQSSFQNTFRVAFPGSPDKRVTRRASAPSSRPQVLTPGRWRWDSSPPSAARTCASRVEVSPLKSREVRGKPSPASRTGRRSRELPPNAPWVRRVRKISYVLRRSRPLGTGRHRETGACVLGGLPALPSHPPRPVASAPRCVSLCAAPGALLAVRPSLLVRKSHFPARPVQLALLFCSSHFGGANDALIAFSPILAFPGQTMTVTSL